MQPTQQQDVIELYNHGVWCIMLMYLFLYHYNFVAKHFRWLQKYKLEDTIIIEFVRANQLN